jgi:hypothetical protein
MFGLRAYPPRHSLSAHVSATAAYRRCALSSSGARSSQSRLLPSGFEKGGPFGAWKPKACSSCESMNPGPYFRSRLPLLEKDLGAGDHPPSDEVAKHNARLPGVFFGYT